MPVRALSKWLLQQGCQERTATIKEMARETIPACLMAGFNVHPPSIASLVPYGSLHAFIPTKSPSRSMKPAWRWFG